MQTDSGAERCNELPYSLVRVVGLTRPRPPRRTGRARSSLLSLVGVSQPVKDSRRMVAEW